MGMGMVMVMVMCNSYGVAQFSGYRGVAYWCFLGAEWSGVTREGASERNEHPKSTSMTGPRGVRAKKLTYPS